MERLKIHERIGVLRAKQGMSGEEFAAALGFEGKNRRSTINNWESGANNVKANDIENICRVFGVSADWLLGLSDVETPNAEVQAICNYTGLSESAVEALHNHLSVTDVVSVINKLFDSGINGFLLLSSIGDYLNTEDSATYNLTENHGDFTVKKDVPANVVKFLEIQEKLKNLKGGLK